MVETGWEVMLINRALQEGEYSADTILKEYTVCATLPLPLPPGLFPSLPEESSLSFGYLLELFFLFFIPLITFIPSLPALFPGFPSRVPHEGIRRSCSRSLYGHFSVRSTGVDD